MESSAPFQIVAYGPEQWHSFHVFNGHGFPKELGSIVHSCSIRMALVLVARNNLKKGITDQQDLLVSELNSSNRNLYEQMAPACSFDTFAVADGLAYLGPLYAYLMLTKSFLDVYAKLMGKLITSNLNWTFGEAKVDRESISGGRQINWFRNSAPKTLISSQQLADILTEHSRNWITPVVELRNIVGHYSEIPGFRQMCVKLNREQPIFDPQSIVPPALPNGMPLPALADMVVAGICKLVAQTLVLLPNVVQSEINIESFENTTNV